MSRSVAYLDAAALWVAAHPKTSLAIFVAGLVAVAIIF